MQHDQPVSPIDGEWLVELIDVCGGLEHATRLLRALANAGQWPVSMSSLDEAGIGAIRHHLALGRLVDATEPFERPDAVAKIEASSCRAAADAVELVAAAIDVANKRRPPEPSRLVVTATSDVELVQLTDRLGIRRLWDLIEFTIRSARERVALGAPFWNRAALDRLRPALEGARDRDVVVDFVVQGGRRDPSVALDALHAFAHELRNWGVEVPGYDTVTVWQFDADELAARHTALHAKFAVADASAGYLGSTNMTDQGLEINFEIGALLGPRECEQLLSVLELMRDAGVLRRS